MPTLVPLSQGQHALVSDEDAERVLAHKWSYHGKGYACRSVAVTLPDGRSVRRKILLHRFVVDAPPHLDVDHENGNGLDCQRHNLRVATRSQNMANTGSRKGSASQYKGVYLRQGRGTWRAEITINGRKRDLGTFREEARAASAYDCAAIQAWGQFTRLNFPELRPHYQFGLAIQRVHSIPTMARRLAS